MSRGRPRKNHPPHIDGAKIPRGCYWDSRDQVWYVIHYDPKPRRQRIADAKATLSQLHGIMEDFVDFERGSVSWLLDMFHESSAFKKLAPSTRAGYEKIRRSVESRKTKIGPLGALSTVRLTRPAMQTLVDAIADEGTPTKANHLLRYLRRVFHWGMNRDHCKHNPFSGLEQATERAKRRVPTEHIREVILAFCRARGKYTAHREGAVAPYLWPVCEIAYLCRLRGIEVVTLTDANVLEDGLLTNRRKGSRDNITKWSPKLRAAVDAAQAHRGWTWERKRTPVPLSAAARALFVNQDGQPLKKGTFDSAWQTMIRLAIQEGVISVEQRFSVHGLKHAGITDTRGTRGEKQLASGHKSERMLDTYDHSVPIVKPAGE